MFNDLVLLSYGWGHAPGDGSGRTDCFQLACEVRRRLGLRELADQFDWVYKRYTEVSFPRANVLRWLHREGKEIQEPQPGALVYLPAPMNLIALGTCTENGVIFIAPHQNVVHAPGLTSSLVRMFWMD